MTTPLADTLGWAEVLRGSGWTTLDEVPPHVRQRMEWAAGAVWTPVREAWGAPLHVVSGIRSPAVNAAVGGSANSRHKFGDAFDVRPVGAFDVRRLLTLYDLIDRMQKAGGVAKGGLAIYLSASDMPRFVHFDGRGALVRWNAAHRASAADFVA